jgi:hypothetical protein
MNGQGWKIEEGHELTGGCAGAVTRFAMDYALQ